MNHQKEYEARTFRDYNRKLEEMDDERIEEEINLKQADKRRRLVFLKEMEGTR